MDLDKTISAFVLENVIAGGKLSWEKHDGVAVFVSFGVGLNVIGYLGQGVDVRSYDVEEGHPFVHHLRLEAVDMVNLHPVWVHT